MARFCANCGTEVDETAVFCPTCGQPIEQAAETEMPAAPAWPEPTSAQPPETGWSQEPNEPARETGWSPEPNEPVSDTGWAAAADATERPIEAEPPTRFEERLPSPESRTTPPPPPPAHPGAGSTGPTIDLPITTPVTLSAWLIGIGALLGVFGVLIGLFGGPINPVELILLLALLGIVVTVFFSANVPAIPHLRLVTLAVVLVGFGIALDRIGFGVAGVGELLLFLGTAAAAIGALILELGRDQPMGGAGR